MGSCGSKSSSAALQPDPPKATTQAPVQGPPEKKFCGTAGYDTQQKVPGTSIFFVDFDQTFAKSHTFKTTVNMGEDGLKSCDMEVMTEWFGGPERLASLKKFLTELTAIEVTTIIVTYGIPKLVKILLERTGFLDSSFGIKGIFGCVRPGILYKKGQAIVEIFESMTGEDFADHKHEVVFADDSRSNIDDIRENLGLPDTQNILIDKTTAMVDGTMSDILSFFSAIAGSRSSGSGTGGSISMPSPNNSSAEDPGVPMMGSNDGVDHVTPASPGSPRVRKLTLI